MDPSVPSSKVFIQIDPPLEQQENVKNPRRTSRARSVLQNSGTVVDKENLIGRQPVYMATEAMTRKTAESEVSQTPDAKRKIPSNLTSKISQTSPSLSATSAKNLEPENFWENEAEKRRVDLEESLTENHELYERIATLEEEFDLSENLIIEAENLVEVLTDILKEDEGVEDVTETSEVDPTQEKVKINNEEETSV